jgi:hypothetical protein
VDMGSDEAMWRRVSHRGGRRLLAAVALTVPRSLGS